MLRWDSFSCHGKPCIALVWERLTLFFSFYHWKKGIKMQRTMRWDSLSSHGLPHIPLVWGQRLTHCFRLFYWKSKKSTTHSAPISVPLQKRKKKHLMRRWHSLSSHGEPILLWYGEEDSPDSLACCPGKERAKQCAMRGTSHPTAHTGRPQRF